MTTIALAGGLLGVLFMVPLRRYLMRGEHGRLPYPEGTACAEVLVASEIGGSKAREVFFGIGIGAVYRFLQGALRLWRGEVSTAIPVLPKAQLGLETSPALLGVGYILGPRIAGVMVGGGLLAWLGQDWTRPLYPETEQLVRGMAPGRLWTRYVRYVGAGAVAMGGLMTLIKSIPTMVESFQLGWEQIKHRVSRGEGDVPRTDRDLSLSYVLAGVGVVVVFLALVPHVLGFVETALLRIVGALLVAVFAFFFVTVSSRIVGLVGIGAAIALVAELLHLPSLAFAVGIYLPVSTMTPVFLGGLLRFIMEKRAADADEANERRERGVLFGSGLVGGEGLLGVGIAAYAVLMTRAPEGIGSAWAGALEPFFPLLPFVALVWLLWRSARGRP